MPVRYTYVKRDSLCSYTYSLEKGIKFYTYVYIYMYWLHHNVEVGMAFTQSSGQSPEGSVNPCGDLGSED